MKVSQNLGLKQYIFKVYFSARQDKDLSDVTSQHSSICDKFIACNYFIFQADKLPCEVDKLPCI